jgi:transposase
MPDHASYRSPVLDHLGLVAGMFDALGLGDVIDRATPQHPDMRDLTVGEAVHAMVLKGLGCMNQARYRVPRLFQTNPTDRLMVPRRAPAQRPADALGRALETLYTSGVTALYRRMAATAAERLGLAPRLAHLDRTSFPVAGRDNSDEAPEAQVVQMTRGDSREHRPDFNPVMWELIVAHQAGLPLLMKPRSGHSRDAQDVGEAVRTHVHPWQTPDGITSLGADSALESEAHRHKLAQMPIKWITRVPATVNAAQRVLAQADPQALASLTAGDRARELTSTDGGLEPRWGRIDAASRRAQAHRAVDKPWRQQRDKALQALKP